MINYINGIIYGIKTSIKFFSVTKNNIQAIKTLCDLQKLLISEGNKFESNIEVWQAIEKYLFK